MTEHNLANDLSNTDYTYSPDVMTGGSDRRMYLSAYWQFEES